jgi:drug/metabolite transporter (DMT)-like permease
VQLAEREQKQLSVVFEPPKPEAALQIGASTTPSAAAHGPVLAEAGAVEAEPRPWRTVGIAAVSVGGAALVASGIAWLVASSQRDKCPNNTCQTVGDLSAYNSARTVSIVSFYTGAALALGGATTWAIATRKPVQEQTHVTLNVGPTSVTVHGSF